MLDFGKFYVDGNYVDEAPDVTKKNYLGVDMGKGSTEDDKKRSVVNEAFTTEECVTQTAKEAYMKILDKVGASFRRDILDVRIIKDVWNRTGKFIDVQGDFPHGTDYELTVTAWPSLQSLPAPADTDKDGMPDEWEKKHGLNPNDPADASQNKLDKHYTNIEVYINSIVK